MLTDEPPPGPSYLVLASAIKIERPARATRATGASGCLRHDRRMRLRQVLPVWILAPVLLLGSCGSEPRPENGPAIACTEELLRGPSGESYGRDPKQNCKFVDENGKIVDQRGATGTATTEPSTTTPTTADDDPVRRGFCTADGRIGPDGQTYGRDPRQGCKFVDENGQVLPDQ